MCLFVVCCCCCCSFNGICFDFCCLFICFFILWVVYSYISLLFFFLKTPYRQEASEVMGSTKEELLLSPGTGSTQDEMGDLMDLVELMAEQVCRSILFTLLLLFSFFLFFILFCFCFYLFLVLLFLCFFLLANTKLLPGV